MRLRSLARWLLGVRRVPTYYVPWITRPGLTCEYRAMNETRRFLSRGPSWDTGSAVFYGLHKTGDVGIALIEFQGAPTDVLVTLTHADGSTTTHGRGEFIEHYPWYARWLLALAGHPALFRKTQYMYPGMALLLLNLSNVPNRIQDVWVPPMGAHLLPVWEHPGRALTITGTAYFNLYVVGVGPKGLDGLLSLQHVK